MLLIDEVFENLRKRIAKILPTLCTRQCMKVDRVSSEDDVRNFYNKYAEDYDNLQISDESIYEQIHFILVKGIVKLRRGIALDVGCGTGAQSTLLASHGYHVVGIDIADQLLRKCANKLSNFDSQYTAIQASARHLPFKNESIDLLVCYYNVLNHIREYQNAISEMSRVIRKGHLVFLEFEKVSLLDTIYEVIDNILKGRLGYYETKQNIMTHLVGWNRSYIITWKNPIGGVVRHWKFAQKKIEYLLEQNHFRIERKFGVKIFVALIPWIFQETRLRPIEVIASFLGKLDRKVCDKKPFNSFGNCTVYILRKT